MAETLTKRQISTTKNLVKSRRSLPEPFRWDEDWQARGVCANEDDTLFYHPEGERGTAKRRRAEAAKAICRTCPVMMECQAKSLRTREPYGTWGGMSEDERAAVLSGKPLSTVKARRPQLTPTPDREPLVLTVPQIPREEGGRCILAGPTIDHLRRLREAGHTLADIARVAGLHPTALGAVAAAKRATVTERTAALVLGVLPESEVGSDAA